MACRHCGKCCLEMGTKIYATPDDVRRWMREGREDIMKHVLVYEYYDISQGYVFEGGEVWFDKNGRKLDRCPFIEERDGRIYCRIQDVKPQQCREYRCW